MATCATNINAESQCLFDRNISAQHGAADLLYLLPTVNVIYHSRIYILELRRFLSTPKSTASIRAQVVTLADGHTVVAQSRAGGTDMKKD